MKRTMTVILWSICLASCSEGFDKTDPTEFNSLIADRRDIRSAEQLAQLFHNYPDNEGTPDLTIFTKELAHNRTEVTLIHDNQEDDSVRGTKLVMIVERVGQQWNVVEIKTNRKCWDGRGHTNWGTGRCS